MRENELLDLLQSLFASPDPSVLVGSGPDDCALVQTRGRRVAVSTDAFVEGSHFLADTPPRDVARKALCASLSDLAASGCDARWALVSLCLRKGLDPRWAEEFAAELAKTAREYEIAIVGGDTVSAESGTFVSVTVLGEPLAEHMLTRGGGRPGDVLVVTGELGGSILGRHLAPKPRLREMRMLMNHLASEGGGHFPHAAMDVSDGLAIDLSRLCRQSGVGAIVDAEAVPVSEAARTLAESTGKSALEHALADGEDFELLIAFSPEGWSECRKFLELLDREGTFPGRADFTPIGVLTRDDRLRLRLTTDEIVPLASEGYQHQW